MVRPTLIDMNPDKVVKYYPQKYVFQKKIKRQNVNMITNKNEAKTMIEHISCYCKCKFNSTTCNSKQRNNKTCQYEYKNIVRS